MADAMAQTRRKPFSVVDSGEPPVYRHEHWQEPPATETFVGDTLRLARQQAGYSLPDISSMLCIKLSFLEALEDGRYEELPGTVYALGFLRSYAEFLGLDTDAMSRRFKEEIGGGPSPQHMAFPAPVPESRVPGGAILMICLLLAGFSYGGWYVLSEANRDIANLVPELPERFLAIIADDASPPLSAVETDLRSPGATGGGALEPAGSPPQPGPPQPNPPQPGPPGSGLGVAPDGAGAAASTPPIAPRSPDPGTVAVAPEGPTAGITPPEEQAPTIVATPAPPGASAAGDVGAASTAPDSGAEASPSPPPPPPAVPLTEGRELGTAGGTARIVIRAVDQSWVQVRDDAGRLVMTRVLEPGDSYAVPNGEGLRLDTGNAGGLSIEVDGRAVPPVGRDGSVVRDIALDAEALIGGTATN